MEDLKKKLSEYRYDKSSLDDLENSKLNSYVKDSKKSKLFLDEILELRKTILEFDREILNLKNEEQCFFKDRYDLLKLINPKHGFQYDLIYSCMFGNGIVID